ncbi:UNVERIFIED_CONTAM: Stearoyl-[acyl-carrier-protein] 9-desaturase 6, chloroplastic [Sesamum angustifolium]|uniref:Stearoyl-[acyl-carrier-protein] 9-desaturase 6, chloroplastic n=1 Tax=Sesamum angustifolium TaxID=2727405 RepID=A0AAW2PD74_9LAMI
MYELSIGCRVGQQSLSDVRVHIIPRASHLYFSWQYSSTGEGGRDPVLARICGTIAADEKRHEHAYVKIIEKLLEVDPNETMLAISKMMRKRVIMPGHLMYDGRDPNLFQHFASVAERIGVYTAIDYVEIMEFLIGQWRLEPLMRKTAGASG